MKDVTSDDVLALQKCIYGLVQAARQYHKKIVSILKSIGFTGGDMDPHCKRKTPTYCRHIQNDSNMPAICRQVANSTSEVG